MKHGQSFIDIIADMSPKAMKILDFFIDNPSFDFSKTYVAKELKISRVTVEKIWKGLISLNIIYKKRNIGRAELYQLNKASPIAMMLMKMDFELSRSLLRKEIETLPKEHVIAHKISI